MDVIKTYLDNVFAAYPQTAEVQKMKRDILASMEEKFNALKQEGKSEHEAAYSVIANFGSIEEITAELGVEAKTEKPKESILLSEEEARTYLAKTKSHAICVGLGVWLIMMGVSTLLFFENVLLLFVFIAIAVPIFIVTSTRMSEYETYEKTPIRFEPGIREKFEKKRKQFMPYFTAMIAGGVSIILLAVGGLTVFSDKTDVFVIFRDVGEFAVMESYIALFLCVIGFAVFLFIMAGRPCRDTTCCWIRATISTKEP
jgi:uncharacterized membrane protein